MIVDTPTAEGDEGFALRRDSHPERHGDVNSVGLNSCGVRDGQPGYRAARWDDAGRRRSADVDLSAVDRAVRCSAWAGVWRLARRAQRRSWRRRPISHAHSQGDAGGVRALRQRLGDGNSRRGCMENVESLFKSGEIIESAEISGQRTLLAATTVPASRDRRRFTDACPISLRPRFSQRRTRL